MESHPTLTIQIDEDHSNMVKFGQGDHRIGIMARKLREICDNASVYMASHMLSVPEDNADLINDPKRKQDGRNKPDSIHWEIGSEFPYRNSKSLGGLCDRHANKELHRNLGGSVAS